MFCHYEQESLYRLEILLHLFPVLEYLYVRQNSCLTRKLIHRNSAYLNNPKLNAERANMRASIEEKREAVSEFLPSVTVSGYIGEQENTNPGDDTNFRPSEQSITVEQKLFQGFGGVANYGKKKHGQTLGEYKLKKIEQEILLEPLASGGIFKITRAPSKPGIQIWSGIIAHPEGMITFTKSIDIVDKL